MFGSRMEASQIARTIAEAVYLVDRGVNIFGRDWALDYIRHMWNEEISTTVETSYDGRPQLILKPKISPLSYFEFNFYVIFDGTIEFTVRGSRRYEGFFMSGNFPLNSIIPFGVSADPGLLSRGSVLDALARASGLAIGVTRRAKILRDVFKRKQGAWTT